MSDLISRQAAIDAMSVIIDSICEQEAIDALYALPSAEAEPVKHGRWECEIRNTIDGLHTYQQFRCSVCGMTYITNTPYCPNCGAKIDLGGGRNER